MPFLFSGKNTGNLFNVSQPKLNSSDRTANLKSKTKYAAATNLAQNGGTLTKKNGSKYRGPVRVNCSSLTSTDSYSDLLDITKGKYLLTPPPSSNLDNSFSPQNGEVYYGNFTVTDYFKAGVPLTMLGFPTINIIGPYPQTYEYAYPDQLVATSSGPVPVFNNSNIVVDPEYRTFYRNGTCNSRNYFKNVYLDPNVEVTWITTAQSAFGGEVVSSRPYNQQQAQRIIANQAQSLRGFKYPTQVHFDFDNCESKPSITPTAPDAPVIHITEVIASTTTGLYEVTISWLHGFDGGSPITYYTVSINNSEYTYQVAPKPCINTFTATIPCGQQIWVTATNCVPLEQYPIISPPPFCTELTSEISNTVTVDCTNPGELPIPEVIIANHSEEGVGLLIGFPSDYSAVDSVSISNGGVTYTISGAPTVSGYYVFYEDADPSPGFWPDLANPPYANVVQVQQNTGLCSGMESGAPITFTYHLSTSPLGVYNTVLYQPPQLNIASGFQYNGGYAVASPFAWNETWGVQVGTGTQTYTQWQSSGSPGIYKYLYPYTS